MIVRGLIVLLLLVCNITAIADTRNFSYDSNGNRTFNGIDDAFDGSITVKQNRHYQWDEANRLSRVYYIDGGAECTLVEFVYDYRHSLVQRINYGYNCTNAITTADFWFFEPDGTPFYKVTKNGLGDTVSTHEYISVNGKLLAIHDATNEQITHYVSDHQNSIVAVVSDDGSIEERIAYAPFGGPLAKLASEYGFLGLRHETDLKLVNLNARLHDPLTRQFLSPDTAVPLALNQARHLIRGTLQGVRLNEMAFALNPYQYGNQNPRTFSDPSGEIPIPLLVYGAYYTASAAWTAYDSYKAYKAGGIRGLGKQALTDTALSVVGAKALSKGIGKIADSTNVPKGGAKSAKQAADLKEHLRQSEKYGQGGVKHLANGRTRYYGETVPANKSGELAGRRTVREWDPATGNKRTWHETVDHSGNVRQVRPELNNGSKTHYTFDRFGNYTGSW